MFSKKYNRLLARTNFPLYTVHCLTERHILVAGGGGGAKTGIPNVIEIYELINNGSTCRAESITHFETGSEAIMNCTVHDAGKYWILFAGMEGNCHVYKIKHSIEDEGVKMNAQMLDSKEKCARQRNKPASQEKEKSDNVDKDGGNKEPDANANVIQSRLGFHIKHLESFQTDFSDDPFQKLVRFSMAKNFLVTAGSDGHVRVWKHPKQSKVHDIEAHSSDVDDIDICPKGMRIVSASRDGTCKVWDAKDGKLITGLVYTLPPKSSAVKYKFRSCRFGLVEDKNDLAIFATLNPAVRSRPPSPSYLCKWDTCQYMFKGMVCVGTDMVSSMTVSDNGLFIGLGTQGGGVKMFIAFSLQLVYNIENVHGIFVTGLEFLPSREESRRIVGGHEASLISISVDNHVIVHHIPMRPSMGILTLVALLILTMFIIFVLMDFLNL